MLRRSATLVVLALAMLPTRADATVLVEVQLEDMIRDASLIVHAVVVDQEVVLRDDPQYGRAPYTRTTFAVREWVAAEGSISTHAEVVLEELGGDTAGESLRIEGTPAYTLGQEVLLFAERDDRGHLRTYGLMQGRFEVFPSLRGDAVVRRAQEGVSFARWQDGRMSLGRAASPVLPLRELVAHVRAVLGAHGGRASLSAALGNSPERGEGEVSR